MSVSITLNKENFPNDLGRPNRVLQLLKDYLGAQKCIDLNLIELAGANGDIDETVERHVPSDIYIMWGCPDMSREDHILHNDIMRRKKRLLLKYFRAGKTVVVIENGYIDRKNHVSIGLNDLAGFGDYGVHLPPRGALKPRFDIPMKPLRVSKSSSHVLFLGQVPRDQQIRLGGRRETYMAWVEKQIRDLRRHTSRKILFRKHPDDKHSKPGFYEGWASSRGIQLSDESKSLEDELKSCHCVVAYNSNGLLDACVAGVPAIQLGKGGVGERMYNHKVSDVKSPWFPDDDLRCEVLSMISYYEWNEEEIAKGIPIDNIIRAWRSKTNHSRRRIISNASKSRVKKASRVGGGFRASGAFSSRVAGVVSLAIMTMWAFW